MVGWAEPCYTIIDNRLDSLSVDGFSLGGRGGLGTSKVKVSIF